METSEDDWLTHQQTKIWMWKQEMLWGEKGERVGAALFMAFWVALLVVMMPE